MPSITDNEGLLSSNNNKNNNNNDNNDNNNKWLHGKIKSKLR